MIGLECTYHTATPGLSPKHIIKAFLFIFKIVLHLSCEKNENKQKEAGLGPYKKVRAAKAAHSLSL